MDLIKSLQMISDFRNQLSNDELLEAKKVFQNLEGAIGGLALLYDRLEIEDQSKILKLLSCAEEIQEEVMGRF